MFLVTKTSSKNLILIKDNFKEKIQLNIKALFSKHINLLITIQLLYTTF